MSIVINEPTLGKVSRPNYFLAKTSFKYAPLSDNAAWMFAGTPSGSEDDLVTRLRLQSNWSSTTPDARGITGYYGGIYACISQANSYSFPLYSVPRDQPTIGITITNSYIANTAGQQQYFNAVPMPLWTDCKPGAVDYTHQAAANGTDSSICILRGYEYWEMWQCVAVRDSIVAAPPSASDVSGGTTANSQWQLITPSPSPQPVDFADTRTVTVNDTCFYDSNAFVALQAAAPSEPTGYTCSDGGYIADIRTWDGIWTPSGVGVHATGTSLTGSTISAEDSRRAVANQNLPLSEQYINHIIGVSLPDTGPAPSLASATPGDLSSVYYVSPANRYDSSFQGQSGTASEESIPEGIRWRLEPTVTDEQIMTWAQANADENTSALAIFLTNKATRDYGIIVEDTAGVVGYGPEDPRTAGTPYSPYDSWSMDWGHFGQKLMFNFMKTLAPDAT